MRDHKLLVPIATVSLLLLSAFGVGDDRQKLMRFLGIGWGAGYHAYPPHINHGCGHCPTDRYSRPNFPHCHPKACGYAQPVQGNGHFNDQIIPLSIPSRPHPNQHRHSTYREMGSSMQYNPSQIQSQPLNSQVPITDLDTPALPMIELPPVKKREEDQNRPNSEKPQPPRNSGTSDNPFGVNSYLIPQQKYLRGRPMNPLQVQVAVNPFRLPKAELSTVQRTHGSRPQGPRPNTFNGIR